MNNCFQFAGWAKKRPVGRSGILFLSKFLKCSGKKKKKKKKEKEREKKKNFEKKKKKKKYSGSQLGSQQETTFF